MEPIVNRHVLIENYRIAYGIYGDGEPVVLVHGTPSSSLIWRNVVPHLVTGGYKVHVFDLLGYGHSERPWDPAVDTSISAQVSIVEKLLDFWGLTTTHLVTHDIGGGIAQHLGIFSPGRLRTLTMIDVVSYDSYPSKRTKVQIKAGLEALVKVPNDTHREHFREWLESAVVDKEAFRAGALETYVSFISGDIGQGSLIQHQIRHYDPKHTMELADRIHELGRHPVKLIWGEKDTWQVSDWAYRLNNAIPGSDLTIVSDAGHFSLEDKPDEIAKLILDFLLKHGR
ncbi:alpha/beta fold hydrolase [Pectobacterium versatile]|uniref:alpha/beta fold hydrolase n=1 Tax=Pectobacterium versatile TaxID=2488639 RepID=UPI000D62064A|nr:alpha/beta hydrolase [Pectobacterium versatile]PWD67318.1 alpha/beta hydrolase [Pectobacterium versatile]